MKSLEAGQTVSDVPAPLLALYRPSVQPFLMSWLKYSPSAEVSRLKMPCLLVQGDTDIQVTVADAQRLHSANANCQLSVIPGMNHVLKAVPPDRRFQIASDGDATLPLAPELAKVLGKFIATLNTDKGAATAARQ